MKDTYKMMVFRDGPLSIKQKGREVMIGGYLETFHTPTNMVELIENIGCMHGGGKYRVWVVTQAGKHVKTKTFEISGTVLVPTRPCNCSTETLMLRGCQLPRFHV